MHRGYSLGLGHMLVHRGYSLGLFLVVNRFSRGLHQCIPERFSSRVVEQYVVRCFKVFQLETMSYSSACMSNSITEHVSNTRSVNG